LDLKEFGWEVLCEEGDLNPMAFLVLAPSKLATTWRQKINRDAELTKLRVFVCDSFSRLNAAAPSCCRDSRDKRLELFFRSETIRSVVLPATQTVHDGLGQIGSKTTINWGDLAGILMIAVQAPEQRTAELKQKQAQVAVPESQVEELTPKPAYFETVTARLEALELRKNHSIQLTADVMP
jgi:hypothetical protein